MSSMEMEIDACIAEPGSRKSTESYLAVVNNLLEHIVKDGDNFESKYETANDPTSLYVLSSLFNDYCFQVEGFAKRVTVGPVQSLHELRHHSKFEEVIKQYTGVDSKPNPELRSTRASAFCCMLSILIEAVPSSAANSECLKLVRHFAMLQSLWKAFAEQLDQKACSPDQLVGFPVPFEFVSVKSPKYQLNDTTQVFNAEGQPVSAKEFEFDDSCVISSSLNYCSVEKLGPSLEYLSEILQSKGKNFRVSTALKIYDQILCRLYIMHTYGIVHTDLQPKFLSFGCQEASNVVYVNNFQSAVKASANSRRIPGWSVKFAARGVKVGDSCSPLADLESAFYILLWLLVNKLPWDSETQQGECDAMKDSLWESEGQLDQLLDERLADGEDGERVGVVLTVVTTIFKRLADETRDCQSTSGHELAASIARGDKTELYFEQRKVIACFFRFESLDDSLKDDSLAVKDPTDAWNLQEWCFTNYSFAEFNQEANA